MTVSTTVNKRIATGDNSTVNFAFTFPFFKNSEIEVYLDGVLQTEITDYTLTNDDPGGTVTFLTAPGTSVQVLIKRVIPLTQLLDYIENDNFPAESHEEGLDRLVMIVQQQQEILNRALRLVATSEIEAPAIADLAGNTGKVLRVNASEDGIELVDAAGGGSLTLPLAISEGGTAATTASGARTSLGLGALSTADRVTDIDQDLALSGDISPSQLTASQNDYNPTGLSTATTLRLDSDAARNITGLQGGADGRVLIMHNVGSFPITLVDESASSSAANRFALATDIDLQPDETAVLQYDSTSSRWRVLANRERPVSDTAQATGSGTAFDFTSIPSWATKITVMFAGVSLSGTDDILVQIGDSGGLETSGYLATSADLPNAAAIAVTTSTAGFIIDGQGTAEVLSGQMTLTLIDSANNTWVASHSVKAGTGRVKSGGGDKSLSGTLDRVRITRSGTDTFDAGSVNIMYE